MRQANDPQRLSGAKIHIDQHQPVGVGVRRDLHHRAGADEVGIPPVAGLMDGVHPQAGHGQPMGQVGHGQRQAT